MTTATPPAGLVARLWAALTAWASQHRPTRAAATRTKPVSVRVSVAGLQVVAELVGLAAFAVAGFLVSLVVGFVVLGVVLLVAGNARWQ